jgi:hypothetical protein
MNCVKALAHEEIKIIEKIEKDRKDAEEKKRQEELYDKQMRQVDV